MNFHRLFSASKRFGWLTRPKPQAWYLVRRRFTHSAVSVSNYRAVCNGTNPSDPSKAVSIEMEKIDFDPKKAEFSNKILLRTRTASVHWADINILEGHYGVKPNEPFVPGGEGLFEIVSVGKNVSVSKFAPGSLAVSNGKSYVGSWQQYIVADANTISSLKHSSTSAFHESMLLFQLGQLSANPCTALRMLTDFVDLKAGEYVLQNAANSAVGESTIQIAQKRGLKTINIIRGSKEGSIERSAEKFARQEQYLKSLGADVVVGSDDLLQMDGESRRELYGGLEENRPRLALNAVGGRIIQPMQKMLVNGGTMVTYGGLAKKPLTIGAGPLIFNDIIFRGFWLTRWREESPIAEYEEMVDELQSMVLNGELKLMSRIHKFGDEGQGLKCALQCVLGLVPPSKEYSLSRDDVRKRSKQDDSALECICHEKGKVMLLFDNDWL